MGETEYLLSSENNKEHLLESISQCNLDEPVVDSESVTKLMENMSIFELKMLKTTCDLLIGIKTNKEEQTG